MTRVRHYRTRWSLPLGMTGLALVAAVVVGIIIVADGASLLEALALGAICTAVAGAFAFAIAWQRVQIDPDAGVLRFAGVSTWHRWRSLPMAGIDELAYDDFQRKRKALVSGLVIHMKRADGRRRRHRLMDHSFGGFDGPSQLFREITAAVSAAQPGVEIDPALLAPPRRQC